MVEATLPDGMDPLKVRLGIKERIADQREAIEAAYQKASADSFLVFIRGLKIDSQHGPRLLEGVIASFQREFFDTLAPSLEALRNGEMPEDRRWWIERTKKASKDADLSLIVAWVVAFPTGPFYGQIGAADREQAAIVRDRLSALLHYNPWLNEKILLVGNEIRSTATRPNGEPLARFDIKSSDVAGAHGGTPDLLIVNELSHIAKWEFVENLLDNADGVAQGMVLIATNAGIKGSKAEKWREHALQSDLWQCRILKRPAPWHSMTTVREAEKRNPRGRYRRLWWGEWVSGKGDAVADEDIDASFCLVGPSDPLPEWVYFGGLDLGVSHDHCAFVVLGVNEKLRKIRTFNWKRWAPPAEGKIDLIAVQEYIESICSKFKLQWLMYDPYQAELMAQQLQRKRIKMKELTFSSATNLNQMAATFLQILNSRQLECYDDEDMTLRGDFGKFNIVEKKYGHRLEAVSDETGHADVGTALLIALPAAAEILLGYIPDFGPDDDLTDTTEEEEFTKEEVESLPDELRDIYDMG